MRLLDMVINSMYTIQVEETVQLQLRLQYTGLKREYEMLLSFAKNYCCKDHDQWALFMLDAIPEYL